MQRQVSDKKLRDDAYKWTIISSVDIAINLLFIVESLFVLMSVPISIKIERAFNREIDWTTTFFRSGVMDLIVAILCFLFRETDVGLWFRIARVLTLARVFLEVFPYIEVLTVNINRLFIIIFT
jgi:hypothetical protein